MFKKALLGITTLGFITSFMLGASRYSYSETISKDKSLADTNAAELSATQVKSVKAALAEKLNLKASGIKQSPLPGLYEVITEQGIFYVDAEANYLVQGSIYQILDQGVVDLTEQAMADLRKQAITPFADDMIEYPAKDARYTITVFTDINCGYCRKLHNEIQQYNDLGITVRYLAFPRGGLRSATYRDMVSIWCADEPAAAMTNAKKGEKIASASCKNTVAQQYQLGQRLGVTGTPAIVFANGQLQPGYVPAPQLLNILKNADKS